MGDIHFHRKDRGPHGLTRDRFIGSYGLLEDLAELRHLTTRPRNRLDAPWLVQLLRDIEGAALGGSLQSDRYLLNQLEWTNWEEWLKRVEASNTVAAPQHRIAVRSWVTTHGNLTVRFAPQYKSEDGHWRHASEWREMPYLGFAAIAQRPDDEILFLRGLDRLIVSERTKKLEYVAPEVIPLVCKAANAVFWETLERVSRTFEVFVQSYVVALHSGRGKTVLERPEVVGLEMVDADNDLRADTLEAVQQFEADAGCSIQVFWETWAEAKEAGRAPDNYVSRKLRNKNGPTRNLTPGAASHLHARLEKAKSMGLWHPPPIRLVPPGPDRPRMQQRAEKVIPKPSPTVVAFPGRVRPPPPTARLYSIRYVELSAEDRDRFGVTTAAELVDAVNVALTRAGRKQLAEGDMPNNRPNLKRLLKLAEGLLVSEP